MEKLNESVVAKTLASFFGIWYVFCWLVIRVFGESGIRLFNYFMHGIDLMKIAKTSFSLGNDIVGLVVVLILGYVGGWLFAKLYNYFARN
ncbi:MAG TPA: DUF5676 family membrane protein [Candidatus Nanoarchaeia archaeon]|nr:DUF5676 family membrane protein [Candidatus Nanoarchaeia archaeon]